MNKIYFATFACCLLFLSPSVAAQTGNRTFDKTDFLIKRSVFITAEVGLSSEEATAFIPLCEELQQKKYESGNTCRKLTKELQSKKNPTDAEYLNAVDECLRVSMREAELEKEYYEKFKKILSPEKLYKYKRAETKFAREFMRGPRGKKESRR